jgi:hypothetical protein
MAGDLELRFERGFADFAGRLWSDSDVLLDFAAADFGRSARPSRFVDCRADFVAGFRPTLERRAPDFDEEGFREEFIPLQYATGRRSSLPCHRPGDQRRETK